MNLFFNSVRKQRSFYLRSLILCCCFCCSLVLNAQNQQVTFPNQQITIREAFNAIEKQTGLTVAFNENHLDVDKTVSLNGGSLNQVLNDILKNTNMTFQVQNNRVVISQQVKKQRVISGTVSDEFGEPIIGASIMVKGKTTGTITDFDGNFSLEVNPDDVLSISYIGYLTQEFNPGGQSTLMIAMREDTQKLDEVVVIGYGVVKKKDLTGSVTSLKMQDIAAVPVSNALEALQGKISGLDMTRKSGEAGSGLGFSLRGNRSLNASNEPLILVDGIQYGNTVDINTSDIESIQVLKDASSTAIYGSRGANGVILITTKKGQIGKPVVSFNMYAGVQSAAGLADIQSAEEWVAFRKEAYRTNGITDESLIFNATELDFIKNGDFINWQDICINNGSLQNYEVSLSGGTELSTFNFSLGVYDEKGLYSNDNLRRYNGMLSGDYKLFNNVKIGANMMYTYRDNNKRQDPLNQANKIVPLGKVYDENGEVNIYPASNTSVSPIADEIDGNYVNNTIGKRMFSTSYLDWDILPNLKFKTTLGVDMQDYRQGIYYGQYTIDGAGNQSHSSIENTTEQRLVWENILNWNKTIKKHDFTVLLGHSVTDYLKETAKAEGSNQVSATTSFHDLAGNASEKAIESSRLEERMVSFFGRVNYKFNEKYLFTASLRGDGASQLAAGNKWGYFPSTAVAWRINEESFLQNVDVLSDLKLRASWGISGNSAIDAYSTLGALGSSTYAFGENPAYGYYPAEISNPDLKWEKTTTYNLGVDFGFFNGRISGAVELYLANTRDLLMERIIPATSGYTMVIENVGKTRNKGIEVTLSTVNIDNRRPGGFKWNTDITFYSNKEEIVELISGVERDLSNSWFVGHPTKVFYDYEKIGIWQLGEEAEAAKYGQVPGDIKVKDQNGDGKIDADNDRVIVGTERPKFTMSMNNRFSYKNFDLAIFMYGRSGQMIRSEASGNYKINGLENGPKVDYWTPENPTNSHPRPDANKNSNSAYMNTLWYQNGSFFKIRDITLGYTVPKRVLQPVGIANLRVYGTMKNFFTFSHMGPYDPERGGNLSFPMTRQLIFGLNLTF